MNIRYQLFFLVLLVFTSCKPTQKVLQAQFAPAIEADKSITNEPKRNLAKQRKFDYYYYEAIRLKENQELDKALETFQLCLAIDSMDAGVQSEIGILYYSIGLRNQSLKHLETSIKLDPTNWWYNVRTISVYSELKNWDRAIEIATDLRKKYPKKEEVYGMLASLYKETKEYDKAIDAYNDLEHLMGIDEGISIEKFQLYALSNKNKKAIAEIDKLVEKYPTQTQYKVLRGDIYMQQKMPEQAFSIYQSVLVEDPLNANVYLSLSEYYNEVNQPEKATQSILKALENEQLDVATKVSVLGQYVEKIIQDSTKLDQTESLFKLLVDRYPMEEQVHSYYALFLQFRNRNAEAIAELETMLNINSKNEQTWLKLLQINTAEKNYQAMLETTAKAILELPTTPAWYFYRGIAHYQLNDFENALKTYKIGLTYITKNQNDIAGDFYAQIADVNYKLQKRDSAFYYYEKALEMNPKNTMVMNNYAYYLSLEKKELNKAEKMSARTVELEPKNSTFLDTYAWILYQQGSYSLARFYIERAVDNLPKGEDHSVVLEHCGDIYWMNGKTNKDYEAKALEMWQKALDAGLKTDELKAKIENKGWKRE